MTSVSFREGLVTYLNAQYDLNDMVGGRIHAARLPDKPTLPAVVYRVVTNFGSISHDGPVELRNPRVQLDVWGERPADIEPVAEAIITALLGYRGPMGDVEYTAGWVLADSTDIFEKDTGLYRISMDFRGWYSNE